MPDVATLFSAKDLFAVNDPDYDPIAGFATPEPTTIVILGLGSLYLLRKRKGV